MSNRYLVLCGILLTLVNSSAFAGSDANAPLDKANLRGYLQVDGQQKGFYLNPGETAFNEVSCPTGYVVVGGLADQAGNFQKAALIGSGPSSDATWLVRYMNVSDTSFWLYINVRAICLGAKVHQDSE